MGSSLMTDNGVSRSPYSELLPFRITLAGGFHPGFSEGTSSHWLPLSVDDNRNYSSWSTRCYLIDGHYTPECRVATRQSQAVGRKAKIVQETGRPSTGNALPGHNTANGKRCITRALIGWRNLFRDI